MPSDPPSRYIRPVSLLGIELDETRPTPIYKTSTNADTFLLGFHLHAEDAARNPVSLLILQNGVNLSIALNLDSHNSPVGIGEPGLRLGRGGVLQLRELEIIEDEVQSLPVRVFGTLWLREG